MQKNIQSPIPLSVPIDLMQRFSDQSLIRNGNFVSLADMRDRELVADVSTQAAHLFADLIADLHSALDCPETGIAAVDIPTIFDDATLDALVGSLTAISLTQAIMPSMFDSQNRTPFSIFTISQESEEKLQQRGIQGMSPTGPLEFHSDGAIKGNSVAVPDYISLYNVAINFEPKGCFHWVPTSRIADFDELVHKAGLSSDYYFRLPSAIYDTGQTDIEMTDRRAKVAIFNRADNGSITTFLSGKFDGIAGEDCDQTHDIVAEIRNAISTNRFRYSIPQESRRLIIINNARGFHTRDAFEKPTAGASVSRSYLRSTSLSGQVVGQIIAE